MLSSRFLVKVPRRYPFLLVVFLTALVGCALNNPERVGQDFRASITTSMAQAAERAGVHILTDQIAIATRGNILAANALVALGNEPPDKQKQISFIYLSQCSRTLPAGFYTIERTSEPDTPNPRAQLVNAKGIAVAEFPLHQEIMKADNSGPGPAGPVSFAEVSIEQSQLNMAQTVVSPHSTWCFPGPPPTWYWLWIVVT
jgi:hypothetical protein